MYGVGSASAAGAKGDIADYYCPLYNDVYSGHPDFEQEVYADGCSGTVGSIYRVNNLTSYGNGVRFTPMQRGALTTTATRPPGSVHIA